MVPLEMKVPTLSIQNTSISYGNSNMALKYAFRASKKAKFKKGCGFPLEIKVKNTLSIQTSISSGTFFIRKAGGEFDFFKKNRRGGGHGNLYLLYP